MSGERPSPALFEGIVGQDDAVAALKAAATNGSRIIRESCKRLTVIRNSDEGVRCMLSMQSALGMG